MPAVARLLAWFEACGCKGAVLAGTNGEGPSLSAPEKRDLISAATKLSGKLELTLGIATPSLDEACWLCKQASGAGAAGVLLMAPYYFRDASEDGVYDWFIRVLESSPCSVWIYNFPQKTGIAISPELMARLAQHNRFGGLKDSSGTRENLAAYAAALAPNASAAPYSMFVGNEELLLDALDSGWTGTISGAANVIPMWLSRLMDEYARGLSRETVEAKFELVLPCLSAIRSHKQPAMNKALLHRLGVLPSPDVRPPLTAPTRDDVDALAGLLHTRLGLQFEKRTLDRARI